MTIINRDHRFIFLKSRKTASSSIENFLISKTKLGEDIYCTSRELLDMGHPRHRNQQPVVPGQTTYWYSPSRRDRALRGKVRGMYRIFPELSQHDSAIKVRFLTGRKFFDNALKVVPVRNPWDALVSYYHWDKSGGFGRWEPMKVSWDEWLELRLRCTDKDHSPRQARRFLFYDHLFLGKHAIDARLVFFEDIQASLTSLAERLGMSFPDFEKSGIHLKKASRTRDYREYFSDAQADLVADVFGEFLKLTDYRFDAVGQCPSSSSDCSVGGGAVDL